MVVRLSIFIKKVDTMTNEEFNHYWSVEHPKAWLSVKAVQENITKYSQFHIDKSASNALTEMGLPMAEYDGAAEMWANNMGELMGVFEDEEYHQVVIPDEKKFLKREETLMMFGYDELKWENGHKV